MSEIALKIKFQQKIFRGELQKPLYQAKTACGKLQLCAGIEVGIEGETHAVGQRRLERLRERRREEELRRN